MNVDKMNIDDQVYFKYLVRQSKDVKSIVGNELGYKTNVNEETIILQKDGIDDEGNDTFVQRKEVFKFREWIEDFSIDNKVVFVGLGFVFFTILNLVSILKFGIAYKTLNLAYTSNDNIIVDVIVMILPLIIWAFSTNFDQFNFRNIKLIMFQMAYWFMNFMIIRISFIISYEMSVPLILKINPTTEMTIEKIIGLAYISTTVPLIVVFFILFLIASRSMALNRDFLKAVEEFRLFKVLELENYPKSEYTYSVVRDIRTGSNITIPQKDRQMHTAIIGATGTAKTSSVLLPSVLSDLKVRHYNKNKQRKLFAHYTEKGIFVLKTPFEDKDFSAKYFEPNPNYELTFMDRLTGRTPERIYEEIITKYQIAGQTILVPEDSLADDACKLFEAYDEPFNRVDPKRIDGKHKSNFKGMNSLYISPNMPEWAVPREKVRRATLLADVMQIMFEMGGKSDPYFASVNRIATTTVTLLLELTYPEMKGRQPHIGDVQDCLSDFKRIYEPYSFLFPNDKITMNNKKYLWLKDNINNFFMGEGASTFEQHARGLRVQFSLFLADDYIRDLVTADEVVDFDGMLSNNELTVVNIELPEIGPLNSPALGLFFSVNMTNAVLRRPGTEFTRSFHVWRVDEFPIIVTPSMEQAFTLFRKFKVAMEVALQTLDQMEKTPFLKYLKGVILNSTANQIVFGRANLSEMDNYSLLAGMVDDVIDMEGTSETSLLTENPSISFMKRATKTKVNRFEPGDIRNKDFQEITYFYTKKGSLMPPKHGKVDFIKKREWKGPKKKSSYDWSKFAPVYSNAPLTTSKKTLKLSDVELQDAHSKLEATSTVNIINVDHIKFESEVKIIHTSPNCDLEIENNNPVGKTQLKEPVLNIESTNDIPVKEIEKAIDVTNNIPVETTVTFNENLIIKPAASLDIPNENKTNKFDLF